ncbi:MAG: membrane-bound PQQ-dependent dehydrogenase, glucose/quinate/shikimate family [Hyphomicrobiaceae bacterium]|nr:membrane-bound PQQ-dependent dehydrogenase, glucose/quinate/shikimate family [Hyphomicrobiaceae bacterium]MCC0009930.1 membrane-bound PQQ-dependent dehydrogenase, glucose/quinate/shikimate family [Hyphomicrobiaceae bacterium]
MQNLKVHWLVRLVALVTLLAGLSLLVGGVYLITLGGSWYYALAGAAMSLAGAALWQGRIAGVRIYLLFFIFTLVWSFYETGLAFWPSVPRLVAPIFLAALVLLVVPLLPRDTRPVSSKSYFAVGLALAAMFVGYLTAMFYPHDIIVNTTPLAKSDVAKTTTDAGNNWYAYGRTGSGSRFAPFTQITPENIDKLEVAWTARTGFLADQSKHEQDQTVPLYVDGTLYHCGPVGQITALDGDTGKIKWKFDPKAETADWKRCRSIGYFDPGPGDSCGPRLVESTVDARLISVRASDGKPCETFGDGGTVSLWAGMGKADANYLTNSSGPVVAGDKIVVGGRVIDNVTLGEPSGVIRAYDARTGALAWVWDMGNPTLKGLPPEGQSYTVGTPNAWSLLAFDVDLGMVYVPLGNATPDIWGGTRRDFDDEYSSSVVALDLNTGDVKWHFQTTHHDLWDYDVPSQPVLADIPDGKGGFTPGLIQTTKRAQVFVLDRRTGEPIKRVVEKPAPKPDGTVKGDRYSETQPYSTDMAAIGTEPLTERMMWGATPIDQMVCRILFHKYRYDGEYTTPSTHKSLVWPGPMGGMNFGSAAVDESRKVMVAAEMRMPLVQNLLPRDKVTPDMKYTGESGAFHPMLGTPYAMQRGSFSSPLGIPCLRPPWGTISAIDLATGKHIWQFPAGSAQDLALGKFQPGIGFYVGLPPLGGPMITGGGIAFYAGFQDYYLRAFDIQTGDLIWKGRLPIGTQATPMSYVGKDGRQYIVISAGGARYNMSAWGDYIVAFALPK